MKAVWEAVLQVLKNLDWQKLLYELYTSTVKTKLESYVKDTENKFDDAAFAAVDLLVDKFLKPENK